MIFRIDAKNLHFRELNKKIDNAINNGATKIFVFNVHGQYYIGRGLCNENVSITIDGIPGNDLGVFMGRKGNGPSLYLKSSGQDNIGNTMNGGNIIVNGNAGNILGYGMRGGKIFIKGNTGQRAGIHMKSTSDISPTIVIGGCAGNFLGEYMAGGTIIILGLHKTKSIVGTYLGTGMHGGKIYLHENDISKLTLSNDANCLKDIDKDDFEILGKNIDEFKRHFGLKNLKIIQKDFVKIIPKGISPYKQMYVKIH